MSDIDLSKICDSKAERDAIHIAILPALVTGTACRPGQKVSLRDWIEVDGKMIPRVVKTEKGCKSIGVISPYLEKSVKDQYCYVMLNQNTITSLRHVWEHPDLPSNNLPTENMDSAKYKAFQWLSKYADSLYVSLDELLIRARDYIKYENYWCEGGRFESLCLDSDFWDMYQIYTGEIVPENKQHSFFTCSC